MNETIILINGMAYKCKRAKITINNNLEDANKEWGYSMSRHSFSSAMIEITKATPLSNFKEKGAVGICQHSIMPTIELMNEDGSMRGQFVISSIKEHKKGAV